MKALKKWFVFSFAVLMLVALNGCGSKLSGEDLIQYYNTKRESVIKEYVGAEVKLNKDATTQIKSVYYDVEGKTNQFEISIENENEDYFFHGTIKFTFGTQIFNVNVHMLAPGSTQYFMVNLNAEPVTYKYVATGKFYDWKSVATLDIEFEEIFLDETVYDEQVILNVSSVSEAMAQKLAKHFYSYDTLFNYNAAATYYLVTKADYDDGYDYNYIMIVDTLTQTVTYKDYQGTVIKTFKF